MDNLPLKSAPFVFSKDKLRRGAIAAQAPKSIRATADTQRAKHAPKPTLRLPPWEKDKS